MTRTLRLALLLSDALTVLLAGWLGLWGSVAGAHPLGNSTVNRQAGIVVRGERVEVHYLLDLAEIPALIAQGEADADADGETSTQEWEAWTAQRAASVGLQLHLTVDGDRVGLVPGHAQWRLDPAKPVSTFCGWPSITRRSWARTAQPGSSTATCMTRNAPAGRKCSRPHAMVRGCFVPMSPRQAAARG